MGDKLFEIIVANTEVFNIWWALFSVFYVYLFI